MLPPISAAHPHFLSIRELTHASLTSAAIQGLVAPCEDGGVDSTGVREQVARRCAKGALRLAISPNRSLVAHKKINILGT